MPHFTVKPPAPVRFAARSVVVLAAAGAAFMLIAGMTAGRPVTVVVDGRSHVVPMGTTLGQLASDGAIASRAGNLIGVDGSLVRAGGGDSARIALNGREERLGSRLYAGDVVSSETGEDRRESVVTTDVVIPFEVQEQGRGPVAELVALGAPGVRRVTMGEVSGIELTSTVLSEPSNMVMGFVRPANGKVVVLTFDDGPNPTYTRSVLGVLARHRVKAVFFMLGSQVRKHPALARQVVAEGHSVGNHTYSHKQLTKLTPSQVRRELVRGRMAVRRVTGVETQWARPPYGAMDGDVWKQLRALNMRVALWDVDSRDWTKPGARNIARSVVSHVKPGSVILMHDGGGDRRQTAQAINIIIPALQAKGYTFVTLDELVDIQRADRAAARQRAAEKAARTVAPPAPTKRGG